MRKIAIFVEGQSELIFVREYLLKQFDYQGIDLECRNLFNDEKLNKADYDFPNKQAANHFQIINVGSDVNVLSRILKREQLLWNTGYERIVGLRDMYSRDYIEAMKQPREIKPELNLKFIEGVNKTIEQKASKPQNIKFHFAIMEIEAWLLAIPSIWQAKRVSADKIKSIFKGNHLTIDPETTFVHPAETIKAILRTVNESYDKHASEIESLVSFIKKEDFLDLQQSNRCNSFKTFTNSVI